jgi:release factor glutamine methyltransferase
MTVDSKKLFQQLLGDLTFEMSTMEKETILLWVMEHELGLTQAEVMAGKEVIVHKPSLQHIIERLNRYEPVQYILGEAEFYGRKFQVGPPVLIPRPETECLIDLILDHFRKKEKNIKILDIGTGSGCIAITLALELSGASVSATDVSQEALKIAASNTVRLNAHVQFFCHDILQDRPPLTPLDVVVSNPPYILNKEKPSMPRNVVDYEPSNALFVPDASPLLFHSAIAEKAKQALNSGGLLLTEINEALGKETAALYQSLGYEEVEIVKDLRGRDRVVKGRMPEK